MTQRFGGLFSTLSSRDYSQLRGIIDKEEDTLETEIPLETFSDRDLYWYLHRLEDFYRGQLESWSVSKSKGFGSSLTPELFTELRQDMSILRRLKAKVKTKLKGNIGEPSFNEFQ